MRFSFFNRKMGMVIVFILSDCCEADEIMYEKFVVEEVLKNSRYGCY